MSSGGDSATSSPKSEQDEETEDEDWDEEEVDEELMELREVLEKSRVTVSYLEESGDSLDNEDNEIIKAKLRALRDYVRDLQASYNELLQTFKLLEDAAKQKVSTMENKLATALTCAKDFQDQCNTLESQLRELRKKSKKGGRVSSEPGVSIGINSSGSDTRDQIEALEEDLSLLLRAITEGIESGVIKLSELQLSSQESPLPLYDVLVQAGGNNDGVKGSGCGSGNDDGGSDLEKSVGGVIRKPPVRGGTTPMGVANGLVSVDNRENQLDSQVPHPLTHRTTVSMPLPTVAQQDQGKTTPMGVANAETTMMSDQHPNQFETTLVPKDGAKITYTSKEQTHSNSEINPINMRMSPVVARDGREMPAQISSQTGSDDTAPPDSITLPLGVLVPNHNVQPSNIGRESNTLVDAATVPDFNSGGSGGAVLPDSRTRSDTDSSTLPPSSMSVPDSKVQPDTAIPNFKTHSDTAAVVDSRTPPAVPGVMTETDTKVAWDDGTQTIPPTLINTETDIVSEYKPQSGAVVRPSAYTERTGSNTVNQTGGVVTDASSATDKTDSSLQMTDVNTELNGSYLTDSIPYKTDQPPVSKQPLPSPLQNNTQPAGTLILDGEETQTSTASVISPHSHIGPSYTMSPLSSGHTDAITGKPQSLFPNSEDVPLSRGTQTYSQPDTQSPSQAVPPFQQSHSYVPIPQSHSHVPVPQPHDPESDSLTMGNYPQSYSSQSESFQERLIPKLEAWNESNALNSSVDEFEPATKDEIGLETDDLLAQMLEKECRIAELETCVEDLQYQLQESLHTQESTQLSLDDAQEMLRNQRINNVLTNEQELSGVMSKLSHYETERAGLQQKVEKERERVLELEDKRDENLIEMEQLRKKIVTLSQLVPATTTSAATTAKEDGVVNGDDVSGEGDGEICEDVETEQLLTRTRLALNESNLQSLREETEVLENQREELQKQCVDVEGKVGLLQNSLRAAKHEAHRLQATSARKEAELKRLVSAIHAARAKLSTLHQMESNDETGVDSIKGLEWDLSEVKKKWEELCEDLSKHEAAMASLIGRELTLQGELDHRAARVLELEALVQARDLGMGFNKKSVSGLQTALGLLKSNLTDTQTQCVQANGEMEEVHRRLNSAVHSLVEQLECLKKQVSSRDDRIDQLETEQTRLWSLYQTTKDKIKEEEQVKYRREQALLEVSEELSLARQKVEELEDALERDEQLREKDLDYQSAVVMDIISQLSQVTGEENEDNDEQVVLEPNNLQSRLAQRDLLLQTLQEQTALLLEQHANTVQQVDDRQDLVRSLESKLLMTQTLCDALEQEVADGHKKFTRVQQQLLESEREKIRLQGQLLTLQSETEDACSGLERTLNKNALLEQQSRGQLDVVQKELLAERTLSVRYKTKLEELAEMVEEREEELIGLRNTVGGLELENVRLQAGTLHHQSLVAKLKEESDLNSSSSRRELAQSLVMVDTLQSQLSDAELAKETAETIAQERLQDVMALQEQNQQLSSFNRHMEYKLSTVDTTGQRNYKEKIDCLDEEMATVKVLYEAKSVELDKLKYSYQVSQERESQIVDQLEECRRELAVCKKRADELDIQYQNSLTQLSACQTELEGLRSLHSSHKVFQGTTNKERVKDLTTRVRILEGELKDAKESLEKEQSSVLTVRQEKRNLLHKLGALEEHHNTLIRTSSQQKLDLSRSKNKCDEQRKLCLSLQSDYDSLTEQVSDWADKNSTTTDALVQKIREQDNELSSLKTHHKQLVTDNRQLREQLVQASGGDTTHPPSASAGTNDLPQLGYQYQQLLEKGLSSTSALDTSGYSSPAESTDDLDKSYWIRRAGELSIQLQQSSEYWSGKVREQALRIQKYESK